MLIFYILLIAYILSVNFYAFLLVKTLRDQERQEGQPKPMQQDATPNDSSQPSPITSRKGTDRPIGKLLLTGALGGAITIYVCMFLFKYRQTDLWLMILTPVFGVLNVYLFFLLFRSGFGFLIVRWRQIWMIRRFLRRQTCDDSYAGAYATYIYYNTFPCEGATKRATSFLSPHKEQTFHFLNVLIKNKKR